MSKHTEERTEQLLASVMRKVLLSEDMYVDDDDRLLLDGHVHGGITSEELEAVRRVLAEREDADRWTQWTKPTLTIPHGGHQIKGTGRVLLGNEWHYYHDGVEITWDEYEQGVTG